MKHCVLSDSFRIWTVRQISLGDCQPLLTICVRVPFLFPVLVLRLVQVKDVLTRIPGVNKNDAINLFHAFGSIRALMQVCLMLVNFSFISPSRTSAIGRLH